MNRLKREKQVAILSALSEGMSVRATERLTGVHRDSILRLLVRVGKACAQLAHDDMRNLSCSRLELDEQWTFVGKKQRRLTEDDDEDQKGDFWIWAAFDPDTKAVPTFRLGKRDATNANAFVKDLAKRMQNRVQISADGLALYLSAIERAFGGAVDFGMVVKSYAAEPAGPGRYGPPRVSEVKKQPLVGSPNEETLSTSGVERLNLTTRMRCRRLTRLVDSHSRKLENLQAALDFNFAHYNWVKRHEALGGATPAIALGVAHTRWSTADLVGLAAW